MNRMIRLLPVLVFCMYLPCTVFAVSSPGDNFDVMMWTTVMIVAFVAWAVTVICYRKFCVKK